MQVRKKKEKGKWHAATPGLPTVSAGVGCKPHATNIAGQQEYVSFISLMQKSLRLVGLAALNAFRQE